eukprot:4877366-Alexandrium_andersonii.AAC.1
MRATAGRVPRLVFPARAALRGGLPPLRTPEWRHGNGSSCQRPMLFRLQAFDRRTATRPEGV